MTGYPERMRVYLAEMFPLGRHLLIAAVTYLATAAFARDVHETQTSVWSAYLLLGVWSYLTVPLMLRLMDELKDLDIDRALFAERPLPSGRVKESDIKTSLVVVIVIYLGTNAVHRLTLVAAVVITAYALFMFKRFFAEQAHQDSLPLTLATHNPIVPLSLCYGFFLFGCRFSPGRSRARSAHRRKKMPMLLTHSCWAREAPSVSCCSYRPLESQRPQACVSHCHHTG